MLSNKNVNKSPFDKERLCWKGLLSGLGVGSCTRGRGAIEGAEPSDQKVCKPLKVREKKFCLLVSFNREEQTRLERIRVEAE